MTQRDDDQQLRLRERIATLRDELQAGRVKFMAHLADDMQKSLLAVRYGPNGEVDLDTVDGRVRALALAVATMKTRSTTKQQASLVEIQHQYFEWLHENFGHLFEQMSNDGLNPDQAGRAAAATPAFVTNMVSVIPKFMEVLSEFWAHLAEPTHLHLEDAPQLKAIFGGDLFPSAYQNIASTCGLYVDTIVLPDPFLRSAPLIDLWSPKTRTHYFVKHALNILSYRELAVADVDPPIVVIAPDRSGMDAAEQDLLVAVSRADAVAHTGVLFGRSFESLQAATDFADGLQDTDAVARALARPDRLLFDVQWQGTVQDQLTQVLTEQPELRRLVGDRPGRIALTQAVSRMMQANDLLLRTQRLRGVPLIDALTSWRYFQWKLEYDASRFSGDASRVPDLHVVRALQAATSSGRVSWLGRVPSAALIDLRRQQAIEEIRRIVGDGVSQLSTAMPENFGQTADLVVANLDKMLADHEQQMRRATNALVRFGFTDVGSWLTVGGVEVAAAATGMPLYGLAALAGQQLFDVPKLKDLPMKIRSLLEQRQEVRRSPVGLLFKPRD